MTDSANMGASFRAQKNTATYHSKLRYSLGPLPMTDSANMGASFRAQKNTATYHSKLRYSLGPLPMTDSANMGASFRAQKIPQPTIVNCDIRSGRCPWRRRRDLNPRATYAAYSLSRGAPSANLGTSPNTSWGGIAGGEGGIRTHGPFRSHWFSRPAP